MACLAVSFFRIRVLTRAATGVLPAATEIKAIHPRKDGISTAIAKKGRRLELTMHRLKASMEASNA